MTKGKKGLSEIVFILDESGSMFSEVNDTIGGFNQFIQTQREMPGEAKFTLVKFNASFSKMLSEKEGFLDKGYDLVHNGVDLADVPNLTNKTYVPSGGTALLDAVGMAITSVKERIKKLKKADRPETVVFAVLTDGEENASKEYKAEAIKKLVETQEKKGWTFLFLGADINAWDEGSKFGFANTSASVSKGDMKAVFSKMSYYVGSSRSMDVNINATMDTFNMSDEEIERGLNDLKNKKN